jgi:beta-glucosidase
MKTEVVLDVALFPAEFRWGVATAAYQIEGAAREGGRGTSIWDTFANVDRLTLNGDNGDVACDHYHRWESDLDLMASLGVRDYRLSLSWARLQPTGRGELNPEGVAFYTSLLNGLRARGIRPFVTLYHWDLPQVLEDQGGWPARETAYRFADYAVRSVRALGHLADDWITINEPWCVAFLGYGRGAHAPGKRDWRLAVAAAHHVNLAHGLAVEGIRSVNSLLRVGNSNLITDIEPRSDSADDAAAVVRLDAMSNRFFLDPVYLGDYSESVRELFGPLGLSQLIEDGDLRSISQPVDFVGVNHYQRVVAWDHDDGSFLQVGEHPAEPATTSFGWSVIPDSLHSVLRRVSEEYSTLPIFITENGASFHDYVDPNGDVNDAERVSYLSGYLAAAARAIREGVNLQGYYAWSFLDNFEWAEGYSKRFGLVYVDYRTQERIPKKSALWYADQIAQHRMDTEASALSA